MKSKRGFTLVELLVVIAVIVLAMALALPAIRSLTGSRSVEAAENSVGAYLAQVRTEAIGLQRTEGVMFLLDVPNDRVMCIPVVDVTVGPQPTADPNVHTPGDNPDVTVNMPDSPCVFLDALADRDPYYLPSGVRLFLANDQHPSNTMLVRPATMVSPAFVVTPDQWSDAFPNRRYMGANTYPPGTVDNDVTTYPIGVILFGADGKLMNQQWGMRMRNGAVRSNLANFMYSGSPPGTAVPQDWPRPRRHRLGFLTSSAALALVDKELFLANEGFLDHDNPTGNQAAIDGWIDVNASAIIVNRYDGTLMRSE